MNQNNLKISVNRQQLIETIKANREAHAEEYKKAKEGFKIELRKELMKKVSALDGGKKVDLFFKCNKPDSHLGDYDEVIEMLEMSTSEEIELDARSFKQYVKNEWDWYRHWHASNALYLSAATDIN